MNRKLWALYASLAVLTTAAVAADKGSLGVEVNGIPVTTAPSGQSKEEPKVVTREACMSHCTASESRCSTDVRRARSDCSRNAANGGRSPYGGSTPARSGRDPYNPSRPDLTFFCSYFENPSRQCGSDVYSRGCQARLSHRYGLCVDAMNNIADMRYDCYKSERDAQNFCRDELRDCKAACG